MRIGYRLFLRICVLFFISFLCSTAISAEKPLLNEHFESREQMKANKEQTNASSVDKISKSIEFTDGIIGKGVLITWGKFKNISGKPITRIVSMGLGRGCIGKFTLTFPRDLEHAVVNATDTNFTFKNEGKEVVIINDNQTLNKNVINNLFIKFNVCSTKDKATITALFPCGVLYPTENLINKDEFTIEFWVKHPLDFSAYHNCQLNYFGARDEKNRIFLNKRTGTEYLVFGISNAQGKYVGGSWIRMQTENFYWPANTWHYIVMTGSKSKGKAALYIDGKLAASAEGTEFPDSLNKGMRIGSGHGVCPMDGVVDELKIWGRMKTSDEVKNSYEEMKR